MRFRSATRSVSALLACSAVAIGLGSASAVAQSVATVESQYADLRLLPATTGLDAAGEATVGLEFVLDPGWHIYWRSPGDAGLPPEIDWQGSENLASADQLWPRPQRYELLGLQTLAYSDRVIFPIRLSAKDPLQPLSVSADIRFLICSEICVPDAARVDITLPPAGGAGVTDFAHDIDRYEALVPVPPGLAGLAITSVDVAGEGREGTLTVGIAGATALTDLDLFTEAGPVYVLGKPEFAIDNDGMTAVASVPVQAWGADIATLAEESLILTVVSGERAMEQHLVPASFNPADAAFGSEPTSRPEPGLVAVSSADLIGIILIALVGGLILNLMPCVLPVLSLKVLSVVGHGGGEKAEVRRGFLASAAGILVSFLVLAAAAIGLREAGVAIGWGMQFQQPVFLVVMMVIVALFAYSLLGLFHIRLPGIVSDVAAGAGGPGPPKTLRSHFLTGAFATLLATPCSAPFVGTALGFALSRGSFEILAIFAAMGVGLALPYLLIALVPSVATRLPRPGRWMARLSLIFGVALLATGVWLATVLAGQIGWSAAAGVAALIALIGGVFAARRFLPAARLARVGGVAAVVLSVAAIASAAMAPQIVSTDRPDDGIAWQPFDPDAIPALVAEGRTVFVDVTADWCLTCIYNKTAVIDQNPVHDLLNDDGVVAMLADWTNPDPAIAAYLADFGRYGIPFNAVYGPEAPEGIALPELLTASAVLEAVAAATGTVGNAVAAR